MSLKCPIQILKDPPVLCLKCKTVYCYCKGDTWATVELNSQPPGPHSVKAKALYSVGGAGSVSVKFGRVSH